MSKLTLDKYYTPDDVVARCMQIFDSIIGIDNVTEFVEPSAGAGVFLNHFNNTPFIAYDIAPENPNILCQDYLSVDLPYKPNRCVIGNPPYGERMYIAQQFYKKSILIADWVAFILPISQLNKPIGSSEFELLHSEDLGFSIYTDRKLHCCFNIYGRRTTESKVVHKTLQTSAITIYRQDHTKYEWLPYDIRMCYWGNGTAGKILSKDEHYSGEYKIVINNSDMHDQIYEFITTYDWNSYCRGIAMARLKQYHIIEVLLSKFPELATNNHQIKLFDI